MVEPIPFLGLFDEDEPASYLREQIQVQQYLIQGLQEKVLELTGALTKAQDQIAALSVPGLWEHRDFGWEMIRNSDGSLTLRPFLEDKE
jgi:hypothetical protein